MGKKLTYEQIKECFEDSNCELITTKEEFIENNLSGSSKFNVIASCGHPNKNCDYSGFKTRGRGKVCGPCSRKSTKESHKKLNENIQEGNSYSLNLEEESIQFIINNTSQNLKIEKSPECCLADIAIKPINCIKNELLPIQLKCTKGPDKENRYKFHIDGRKYNMIFICISLSNEKIWIMHGNDIINKSMLTMGKNKSKYDIYVVKKDNLSKKLLEFYVSSEKDTIENIQTALAITVQKEQYFRKIRETKLNTIPFQDPEVNQSHHDFLINGIKIQEKVAFIRKNADYFISGISKTRQQKTVPYDKGDNEFYWFHLQGKNEGTFYVIPENKMIEKEFINCTEQKIKGKTSISFGKNNKWLNDFKFYYDEENINEIISNIFKLF